MAKDPAPAEFITWMAAETAAYTAVHELHQRTQGGRLDIPGSRVEQIARLRKEADIRFAGLWRALGAASQPSVAAAPVQRRRRRRPAFELLSRAPAEPIENRIG